MFTALLLFHTQRPTGVKKLWEFSTYEDSTYPSFKQPFPSRPSITSSTTRQNSRSNKMLLCGQQLFRYPYRISPLSVAVTFVPLSFELIHHYSVSPSPCNLEVFVISHEVLPEAPSLSRKSQM